MSLADLLILIGLIILVTLAVGIAVQKDMDRRKDDSED